MKKFKQLNKSELTAINGGFGWGDLIASAGEEVLDHWGPISRGFHKGYHTHFGQ